MLFTQAALCLSTLAVFVAARDQDAAFHKGLTPQFSRAPTPTTHRLMARDLTKRCTGTCEECFGDGYTLCPGSSIFCYLPGDDYYGLDSCSSDSDSDDSTSTDSSDSSSSTGSSGSSDTCYETGATCVSCFGPTYLDCPDGYHCYDPNDPLYDTCPEDDDSSSSSGSGGSGSTGSTSETTCEDIYGDGSIPCGDDSCYNPDDGDVCCSDGYHCEGGYTCSSIVGKCCAPGSTDSSCSGGSSSGGLSTSSATFGLTATTTASGGSATGVSQIGGNGAGMAGIQKGLMIAAGVGALVL